LTGGGSAHESLSLKKAGALYDEQFVLTDDHTQQPLAGAPYRIEDSAGQVLASGVTDEQGRTIRVTTRKADKLSVHWGR